MAFYTTRFVSFRFVSFCFVSFRFVSFRFDLFRFDLFRFVSICFVPFRFCHGFVSHFTGTLELSDMNLDILVSDITLMVLLISHQSEITLELSFVTLELIDVTMELQYHLKAIEIKKNFVKYVKITYKHKTFFK